MIEEEKTSRREQIKKPAMPEAHQVLSLQLAQGDVLDYMGKKYIKMARMLARTIDGATSRRGVVLWLCIEATGNFPSRTVIVPEFVR